MFVRFCVWVSLMWWGKKKNERTNEAVAEQYKGIIIRVSMIPSSYFPTLPLIGANKNCNFIRFHTGNWIFCFIKKNHD